VKKIIVAIMALTAVSGFRVLAADAAAGAPADKPKHEHKTFEQVDVNPTDGKVTLDEFKAAITLKDPAKAEEIFKKKDANSDGTLSKEEYDKHMGAGEHKDKAGGDKK
jgi:hypothetical protein